MFIRPLQVFLQAAAEDELDVLQRFVAEQPIQFRTLKHIPGIFILYGDAVDGDNCAVVIFDFDTGGVDVVLTADSFHRTKEDDEEIFYKASNLILHEFKKMSGKLVSIGLVKISFPVEEIYTIDLNN